ncbi:transcriptional regulator [Streptomyces virginiae]|uniref:Transcriptional regulator n=1 Tax=Streptomyces virginiae TaxID=1961 RepID=A0A0L8N3R5_STRVG|nr:transcriptional regulator [Streptomyces virginiae]
MRSALAALLRSESDFQVAASNWHAAERAAEVLQPDVAIADLDCPKVSEALRMGAAEASLMPYSPAPVLVLARADSPGSLSRALQTGALGYVDKDTTPCKLLHAVRRVAAGERVIDATLASAFMEAEPVPLSPRELSVLARAAAGDSITEIAQTLHLASGTVRNYMAAVTRKTGARNRVDAIRISQTAGWV